MILSTIVNARQSRAVFRSTKEKEMESPSVISISSTSVISISDSEEVAEPKRKFFDLEESENEGLLFQMDLGGWHISRLAEVSIDRSPTPSDPESE